jgi:signal transduction histidine kinase
MCKTPNSKNIASEDDRVEALMAYAAELELEVDRLRSRDDFLRQHTLDHIRQTVLACRDRQSLNEPDRRLAAITNSCNQLAGLLRDMTEPPGYHPAFDRVITVAVRPLAEKVFRWQRRLNGVKNGVLRLELEPEYINWFPVRLRHILDNLFSNALRYCDRGKGEVRLNLSLRRWGSGYELRFADNGLGMNGDQRVAMLDLFHRAAPPRAVGLGVGLPVVKMLVEQCCGTMAIESDPKLGTSVIITLPGFDLDDYVEQEQSSGDVAPDDQNEFRGSNEREETDADFT